LLTGFIKNRFAGKDRKKPFSLKWVFYRGLTERTGSNKARTMIIEDSSYGIIAGKAAGCIVCGLTTSFDAAILKDAGADLTSDNYRELHLSLQ
jgi:phosphoglycolate phosphatase-like HAD superfamily hydrolase